MLSNQGVVEAAPIVAALLTHSIICIVILVLGFAVGEAGHRLAKKRPDEDMSFDLRQMGRLRRFTTTIAVCYLGIAFVIVTGRSLRSLITGHKEP